MGTDRGGGGLLIATVYPGGFLRGPGAVSLVAVVPTVSSQSVKAGITQRCRV